MRVVPSPFLGLLLILSTSPWAWGVSPTEASSPAIWPQWRGPSRDGQIQADPWPTGLADSHLERVWRVELGPSYSGPIVAEDRVFVTETEGEKTEVMRALGPREWAALVGIAVGRRLKVPFFAASNGDWIRATPTYDGERLYVAGMRDVLACLDAATGKDVWRLDFVKQLSTPLPDFGFVSSPLVSGDYLYVQAGSSFAKLDKRQGSIVWRTLQDNGGMLGSAFSSPFPTQLHSKPVILVQTRSLLAGVDPESGTVFWQQEIPAFRGMNILTPTVVNDSVFTSSYGGRSFSYRVSHEDGRWSAQEQWSNKVQGYMSSPVVIDGHIYLHLKNQRFTCIEAATGKECWTTTPFGKYWSLVANGSQILALDERGELLLIRANPEKFELLDRRMVSEQPTWAHLAVCGHEVFVRELKAISAYRWQ